MTVAATAGDLATLTVKSKAALGTGSLRAGAGLMVLRRRRRAAENDGRPMEFFVEALLELILQLCGELFTDQAFRRAASSRHGARFLLYSVVGGVLGGLSLLAFSHHLLENRPLRLAALGLNPVLAGLLMAGLGRWRKKRADAPFGLEAFWPAWGFAFCFGLVRILFAA